MLLALTDIHFSHYTRCEYFNSVFEFVPQFDSQQTFNPQNTLP